MASIWTVTGTVFTLYNNDPESTDISDFDETYIFSDEDIEPEKVAELARLDITSKHTDSGIDEDNEPYNITASSVHIDKVEETETGATIL